MEGGSFQSSLVQTSGHARKPDPSLRRHKIYAHVRARGPETSSYPWQY